MIIILMQASWLHLLHPHGAIYSCNEEYGLSWRSSSSGKLMLQHAESMLVQCGERELIYFAHSVISTVYISLSLKLHSARGYKPLVLAVNACSAVVCIPTASVSPAAAPAAAGTDRGPVAIFTASGWHAAEFLSATSLLTTKTHFAQLLLLDIAARCLATLCSDLQILDLWIPYWYFIIIESDFCPRKLPARACADDLLALVNRSHSRARALMNQFVTC